MAFCLKTGPKGHYVGVVKTLAPQPVYKLHPDAVICEYTPAGADSKQRLKELKGSSQRLPTTEEPEFEV